MILNVVTAPTFTNTSESRLDRRAGDTTSLFCHVKGQHLKMSMRSKKSGQTHALSQTQVLNRIRSLSFCFTICRRAPTHRDLAKSWRSDHLPPARCGSAQLHWTSAAAGETEAEVTRAILVTINNQCNKLVTHSDTPSGTAAIITVWLRMTFPHPL